MVGPDRHGDRYGRGAHPRQGGGRVARAAAALLLGFCAMLMTTGTGRAAEGQRTLKIVALGDSLTAGYNLPGPAAFPAVLERALAAKGHKVEMVNAGVSGDTAAGGLERLDWSVPEGTDGVILELGANDMLRGAPPAETRKALETIITRLKARKIPILLAGMFAARNMGGDYVQRFEAIYTDLAREHGLILYPFFLDGVTGVEGMTLRDGLHPSEAGVRVVVDRIMPSVERFIAAIRGG